MPFAHIMLALLGFLAFTVVHAQPDGTNQTVTAIDSRITYVGTWTVQDNGGHIFTSVPGYFALDFTGSAIYWHARRLYNGAVASVTVDGSDSAYIDLSSGMVMNDTPVVSVLYAKDGLDASQSHQFNVSWVGPGSNQAGSFLENYFLQFTTNGSFSSNSSSSSSSSSSSPSPSSSSSSNSISSSGKSHTGAIVGGVVGGVVGAILLVSLILVALGVRCRRTRTVSNRETQSATPFRVPATTNSSSSYMRSISATKTSEPSYRPQVMSDTMSIPPTSYVIASNTEMRGPSTSVASPANSFRHNFGWHGLMGHGSEATAETMAMTPNAGVPSSSVLDREAYEHNVVDPPPVYRG